MRYIQLVAFHSSYPVADVRRALDDWLASTRGKLTLQSAIVAVEHDQPTHYWELLEYPSEEAARNATDLPETKVAYKRWISLVEGEPLFYNLDVVEHVEG